MNESFFVKKIPLSQCVWYVCTGEWVCTAVFQWVSEYVQLYSRDSLKKLLKRNCAQLLVWLKIACGVSLHKVMSFGSDVTSIMIGWVGGVSMLLKKENQFMINIHCMLYRFRCCTLLEFLIYLNLYFCFTGVQWERVAGFQIATSTTKFISFCL